VDECQSLSLETRLKSGDTISEDEAKRWVRQVAEAISYLHSIGVSHNNLRPENVIFDKQNVIKVVGLVINFDKLCNHLIEFLLLLTRSIFLSL